ncbi:hypothetical protein BGY98DRAFT_514433 [Russula aff. rugulosa BPL654]|nr:hypothetical protein BGY98DRAFT_514433 [Russula aff. rugulosa BPL654]
MFWDTTPNGAFIFSVEPRSTLGSLFFTRTPAFDSFMKASKLKQVTGREHRDIERYIIPAPQISDQTCAEIDLALKEFHDHKDTIISSGARTGKRGKVIDNWYIRKLELLQSVTSSIRESGAAIQWTADTTERYHSPKSRNRYGKLRSRRRSARHHVPSRDTRRCSQLAVCLRFISHAQWRVTLHTLSAVAHTTHNHDRHGSQLFRCCLNRKMLDMPELSSATSD